MPDTDGLLFSCILDGEGGGRFGGWEQVRDWTPAKGLLWVHFDRTAEAARQWIQEESELDEITCAALLADESRPRSLVRGDGLLVDLRGVNLNPGADSDDMISARMFVQESRVITLQRRRLMSIEDVKANVEAGRGPQDAGDFVVALADALDRRMAGSMSDLEERVDSLDERTTSEAGSSLRAEISDLRREIIALRRYLAPQREALARLQADKMPWLTSLHREHIREVAERTTRRVENLDSARERAGVAHEELSGRMAEQMNHTMYILAIVAAIFLPLGLLTGLLGINVGGMPGAEDSAAFWLVCAFLVLVAIGLVWLFRRMKWL
jgi:zinc transporter